MATHSIGYSAVAITARSGCEMRKRASATIRNSASALQTISLDSAEGPCLKKGGGLRSRVPKGIANCGLRDPRKQTKHALVCGFVLGTVAYSLVKMLPRRSMRSRAM